MKTISLFSGIGGGDLGVERAGDEIVLQAEIDEDCREVLRRRFPEARLVEDVRDVVRFAFEMVQCPDGCDEPYCERHEMHYFECPCVGPHEEVMEDVEAVVGGFPCQDVSAAADRWGAAGLDGERSGLWSEFERVVEAVGPAWVIIENVGRLWNGRDGRDIGRVLGALDALGYLGIALVLDAAAFDLPARRPRVFIVARNARDPRGVAEIERLADRVLRDDPGFVVLEGTGQSLAEDAGAARPTPGSYRLLTPVEFERALGLPDGWTEGFSPTRRRQMIGNAMAAPVVQWLVGKIAEVRKDERSE